MKATKIEDVKRGEYFRRKESETSPVYIRGEFSTLDRKRGQGRYSCTKFSDHCAEICLKRGTVVYTDIDF